MSILVANITNLKYLISHRVPNIMNGFHLFLLDIVTTVRLFVLVILLKHGDLLTKICQVTDYIMMNMFMKEGIRFCVFQRFIRCH